MSTAKSTQIYCYGGLKMDFASPAKIVEYDLGKKPNLLPQNTADFPPIKKSHSTKEPNCWKRYIGIGFGLGASFSFSVALLFAKLLDQYSPPTIGLWRFIGTTIPSILIVVFYRIGLRKQIFKPFLPITDSVKLKVGVLLILRGTCGCSAMVLQIYSIKYIALPDSSVIALSTPVFVTFAAWICLGEKCGIIPILAAGLTFLGVSIISRPPLLTGEAEYNMDTLIGTAFALLAMLGSSFVFIILRYLREIHFSVVIAAFGLVGIVECTIVCIITSSLDYPHSAADWGLGLCAGLGTFLGQLLLTAAFKYEEVGPIALTRTCDVIFAFVLQFLVLGVVPDLFSLLGTSIVVMAILVIIARKYLASLSEDDDRRKTYSIFLK